MTNPERLKERYRKRKAAGLCVWCERKAEEGKAMCRECAARKGELKRRQRMKWAAEGRCSTCGGELDTPDKYLTCDKCRAHFRILNGRSREKRRAKNGETV